MTNNVSHGAISGDEIKDDDPNFSLIAKELCGFAVYGIDNLIYYISLQRSG